MQFFSFIGFLAIILLAQRDCECAVPVETTDASSGTNAPSGTDVPLGTNTTTVSSIIVSTVTSRSTIQSGSTTATCKDNPDDNCAIMKPYCSVPAYHDLLEKNCPLTCNFCGADDCYDVSDHCADWNKNGFCSNPFYKDAWGADCKKTCGLCGSSVTGATSTTTKSSTKTTAAPRSTAVPCQDNPADNCVALKDYCNIPAYKDLLEKNCPVTCNFCNAGDCYDVSDKCSDWQKNGFCTSPFYKDDAGKYCKKTCGLC